MTGSNWQASLMPHYWLPWNKETPEDAKGPILAEPTCELYDLVLDMNWHRVVRHCQKSPRDAAYQDGDNLETPLYLACQNRPQVRVIRTLLVAYPDAAITKSRHGDLPLHIACRYNASIECIRELVKDHPETVAQQTRWGTTAVTALWEGRDTTDSDLVEENYNTVFWQKMQVLLEAVARSRQEQQKQGTDTLCVLHAAVSLGSLGCPDPVLKFVLDKYGHQVSVRDGSERLPLHIAVGPTSWSGHSKSSRRKYRPREQQVIARLLELYPMAAKLRDPSEPMERYPLHTALANRHQWDGGVRELVENAPEAIGELDPLKKVYPYQLAAIPVRQKRVDLDTIYHLLRAQPAVLDNKLAQAIREGVDDVSDSCEYSDCLEEDNDNSDCAVVMEASESAHDEACAKKCLDATRSLFSGGLAAFFAKERLEI